MDIVAIVLFIIVVMIISGLVGYALGIGSEAVDNYTWLPCKDANGWLIRPFKHLYCGAVYGHLYIKDTPEAKSWAGTKCRRCGKIHPRKGELK